MKRLISLILSLMMVLGMLQLPVMGMEEDCLSKSESVSTDDYLSNDENVKSINMIKSTTESAIGTGSEDSIGDSELPTGNTVTPSAITIGYGKDNRIVEDNGSIKFYGKDEGDSIQLYAYDEKGNKTPVKWINGSTYNCDVSEDGLVSLKSASYSGSTGYLNITAESLIDSSIKSKISFAVPGYAFSSSDKEKSVSLSYDGQSIKNVSLTGGIDKHTIWSCNIPDGVAKLSNEPGNSRTAKFDVYRPGVFTASSKIDFNENLTDTATITVTGVAVEDNEGKLSKTYLTISDENKSPTKQLKAYCEENKKIVNWSSSNEEIATVDENGVITAKSVGSVIITATDNDRTNGGIKVVVNSAVKPYFESIEFLTTALTKGSWVKDETFSATKFEYDLPIRTYSTTKLTLQSSTIYDTDKYVAEAKYTDIDGEDKQVTINSNEITYLEDIPFDSSIVSIELYDKNNKDNKTIYTFNVTRPRDTYKIIKNNGIVLAPEGRDLLTTTYNGKAEGTFYQADQDGNANTSIGVRVDKYNYRTFAQNGLESFKLNITGNTVYEHLRYSIDDGDSWTELSQGGGLTEKIVFPEKTADKNAEIKVSIQVIDDKTYAENISSDKDGFEAAEPVIYNVFVEQLPKVGDICKISSASIDFGDWYPKFNSNMYSYSIVLSSKASETPTLTFTVDDGSTVKAGNSILEADENNTYKLTMSSTQNVTLTSADGNYSNKYTFAVVKQSSKYDVPDKVTDYMCINSQYTNGYYGLAPECTLAGTVKSLGNFGGYITYYYDTPITDNPNNLYGVDFYVYGNAWKDTSTSTGTSFYEPGQVWVSEDGSTWYALAGSAHYDDGVKWDYTVTYTKNENGKTAWTDNLGNSNDGLAKSGAWPLAKNYFLNKLAQNDTITLSGVMLPAYDGTVNGNGACDAYTVNWGYSDCMPSGTIGEDVNPYLDNSSHSHTTNGFDLKWAVDKDGNPVDVSNKAFHYIKVQTASNIWHNAFAEKSTEISYVVRTTPQESTVGVTKAPEGITISDGTDTKEFKFVDGQYIYEINTGSMSLFSIKLNGAGTDDNIYINNKRILLSDEAKGFTANTEEEKLARIVVQNGNAEPLIYLLKLKGEEPNRQIIDDVKVNSNSVLTDDLVNYTYNVKSDVDNVKIDVTTEGVYTINDNEPADKYELSYGENRFAIQAVKGSMVQDAVLVITREKPVVTPTDNDITVYFTLLGDEKHGDNGEVHTYKKNNLEIWIAKSAYKVPEDSKVIDVFELALGDDHSYINADGNYISEIDGLAEFDNGPYSGWMYLINGKYPDSGIAEQIVMDGDSIVFHYTDNYNNEKNSVVNNDEESSSNNTTPTTQTPATPETPSTDISASEKFSDVPETHWAKGYITDLVNRGLVNGKAEGKFAPNDNITRAEIIAMISRLSGDELVNSESKFTDVKSDSWCAKNIAWAVENKIVNGVSEGKFAPSANVTRQDIAVMLVRYLKYKGIELPQSEETVKFNDSEDIATYATDAVALMQRAGIINGRENNSFVPSETATRTEVAKMISLIISLTENK